METQVDVLEGKRRALARYRDAVATYLDAAAGWSDAAMARSAAPRRRSTADGDAPMPAAVSRLVLGAQEDLRREIARAMHDGPAQSLTNIVLQAQIVERLVERDPASAAGEVRLLIAMVQQTLDATKSFIFDVRPMVLDDLGPRADAAPRHARARPTRGRPGRVRVARPGPPPADGPRERPVPDARRGARRVSRRGARPRHAAASTGASSWRRASRATRAVVEPAAIADAVADAATRRPSKELPPALAAMFEERRADEREAAEAAVRRVDRRAARRRNGARSRARAASIGVTAELLADGGELRLRCRGRHPGRSSRLAEG